MPSKSKAQARLFAIAAKDPEFAKQHGIKPEVAKEWHEADREKGIKQLPETSNKSREWGQSKKEAKLSIAMEAQVSTTNAVEFKTSEWLAGGAYEPLVFSELPPWLIQAAENNKLIPVNCDVDYVVLQVAGIDNPWGDDLEPHDVPNHLYPGDWLIRLKDGSFYVLKEKRFVNMPETKRRAFKLALGDPDANWTRESLEAAYRDSLKPL